MIGRTLSHYRVVESIGAGGMGVVYRARDTHLERDVALKVLPADTLADDAARRRFRKEALALSTLNHPNIATVFDFDTQDGVDFLVMELVPGESLRERLKGGALAIEEMARLGKQLLEGLSAAHARGVVHRDLKPENVRVTPEGRVKVLDFGLATLIGPVDDSATTQTVSEMGGLRGTVPYMAPEQLRGQAVDARTDLFAAGSVLYEMVAGRRPFAQKAGPALIGAILHQAPPSPRSLNGSISEGLEAVLLKSLEKEPGKRYQTAAELLHDLDQAVQGETPVVLPRTTRARRRTLAIAAAAAVVAVVIVAAGWMKARGGSGAVTVHTLLILPLVVRGQQEGAEYVGQALAESLAISLAKAKGLKVLAVPSGPVPAGNAGGSAQMAIASGADRLVTGAVTRRGGALEASLTLLDAAENRVVWGTRQRQADADLPAMADALTRQLTAALGTSLPVVYEDPENLTAAPEVAASPDAMLALAAMRRSDVRAAEEATRRLVGAFPDRIPALALRAEVVWRASAMNIAGVAPAALEEALRALDHHDPKNPYTSFYRAGRRGDTERPAIPLQQLGEILARDDLSPTWRSRVLTTRGWIETRAGRTEEALADLREAQRLDPARADHHREIGEALREAGRTAEALPDVRYAVALDPSPGNLLVLSLTLSDLGRYDEAVAPARTACETARTQMYCAILAANLWRAGKKAEARKMATRAAAMESGLGSYNMACYHAIAGERAEAFRYLRRALEEGMLRANLARDPDMASLHGDPEFEAIVAEVDRNFAR